MVSWADPAVLSTAFLAGLLGSGHCFGMCGGIAAGLGAMAKGRAIVPALQFNLARLGSYALLGLVSAVILGSLGELALAGRWLRLLTALMILLIGLKFLIDFPGVALLEKGGAGIWKKVLPLALRAGRRQDWPGRIILGACWGLLPCGLVYTVLLTAASTGEPMGGAAVMLAFGAGTLPTMLGLTAATPALAVFFQDRSIRRIVGLALVGLALWTLLMMWNAGQTDTNHAHHRGVKSAQTSPN
jgi:sulfite exporter TauE/SafE